MVCSARLFRPISSWNEVGGDALHTGSVNTILEACAKLVRLDYVPQLSSPKTVQGYIEEAGRFEENVAGNLLS